MIFSLGQSRFWHFQYFLSLFPGRVISFRASFRPKVNWNRIAVWAVLVTQLWLGSVRTLFQVHIRGVRRHHLFYIASAARPRESEKNCPRS
jgi:hypothetical protein